MHKTLFCSCAVFCVLFVSLSLFTTSSAQAQDADRRRRERGRIALAFDFDYAAAFDSNQIDNGGGGALRIGTQLNSVLITIIPELTFDWHSLSARTADDASLVSGKIGGRIRFLKILEPGVFAHAGVGHIGGDSLFSHTGFALDAGITLDLTILPLIDFGLHASWNRIYGGYESGTSYGITGAHVALVL